MKKPCRVVNLFNKLFFAPEISIFSERICGFYMHKNKIVMLQVADCRPEFSFNIGIRQACCAGDVNNVHSQVGGNSLIQPTSCYTASRESITFFETGYLFILYS